MFEDEQDNLDIQNPLFARRRNPERDMTDLRAEIPKDVMGVIDATWMARGDAKSSRNSVVNEILTAWAMKQWHNASMVMRLVPSNPTYPDIGDVEASGSQTARSQA